MEKTSPSFVFTAESFRLDAVEGRLSVEGEKWEKAFQENKFLALYDLGFSSRNMAESSSFAFLHLLAEKFVEALISMPELEVSREKTVVKLGELDGAELLNSIPFAVGSEYINIGWLEKIFARLTDIFQREIQGFAESAAVYLSRKRQDIKIPERVFFHLVENKDETWPFAFLATYATKDAEGRVRHMPLDYGLTEFKGDMGKLLELLGCLNRAAEVSPLIGGFIETGELFHPLKLNAAEAYEILRVVPRLEEEGILCRVPNWWKRKASSLRLSVTFGEKKSLLGLDSLLSMQPRLILDGVPLTREEVERLLSETNGLAQIKGKWVEVDKERLQKLLDEMDGYEGEISFLEALRLEAGMEHAESKSLDIGPVFTNGDWLRGILQKLSHPQELTDVQIPGTLQAVLRPYQKSGYAWLNTMADLGLGACLADDMGLGKTLQVLTFLEDLRGHREDAHVLLIVPASLLGNWEKETTRFAPRISLRLLHGRAKAELEKDLRGELSFLTVTTYTMAAKLEALLEIEWDAVILDEAQAIKNPGTKQTKGIKKLKSRCRIAMTGTPIENDLSNLWSLFDFLNKGLLGSSAEFREYAKRLVEQPESYHRLRRMIAPFVLRRLKTDKAIISDLPDKMEQVDYVSLSKKQIVLYRQQVRELERKIGSSDGMARRGLILSAITKLKQICNHPDQFLGQSAYAPADSGKFNLLRDICETIYEKRERVLVFTQYREITGYLSDFLAEVFHRNGLVIHGGTRVKKRMEMVEQFNGEEYCPFMVLSVKAAGTGLNLTAANHVIHFDRWWNPAVENQATDRAYRIGQEKNVMVHKLVSRGTIEERIDEIIEGKRELAENVIGAGEKWITELGDKEIVELMRLDV